MSKTKTIDLSTITSIPTGSNTITVKARAAGFADSNSSNSVTYNKTGNEVTVNFTNGNYTEDWHGTTIYDDYDIEYGTVTLHSSNQIGTISSADGSTTVTTTTGRLFIYGKGGSPTRSCGTTTIDSSVGTLEGTRYESTGTGILSVSIYSVTVDSSTVFDNTWLLYAFTIVGSGTITINGASWID